MRYPPVALLLVLLVLAFAASPALSKVTGVITITRLFNYADQDIPSYITQDNTPLNNPITDEGATLGRVLFYDKRLSADNSISCASCHQQEHAFSDTAERSEGIDGQLTNRHSMRLVNVRFGDETKFRWDESAESLEAQMTLPIRNQAEMGYSGEDGGPGFDELIEKMEDTRYYPKLFKMAFGDSQITEERMQLALAQFVRSIQSFDSKYDEGRAQVDSELDDFPNFTASENNGKRLFFEDFEWVEDEHTPRRRPNARNASTDSFLAARRVGGGFNCAECHVPPEFAIVPDSLNNGFVRPSPPGRGNPVDLNVTRSPTLRDLVHPDGDLNGGMFHAGAATNINALFAHYDFRQPNDDNTNLDPRMIKDGLPQLLDATRQERHDLIAFLETLTGSNVYTDEKWSDPFNERGDLRLQR
ncbi:cytochrome-c peroxidase [Algisphaera agarilytica]|uniref:Cytochrome c peroxidase n=1 Tax=Algisphaera agarilytica TaxID=1385975 RepID=A0A7X0H319_9BACT|nr:cytochrome c peroxidase [Algisphaera agarilytica]MBB6428367.1 cytochrome c peroxidase [Algisphaera agarilytica]